MSTNENRGPSPTGRVRARLSRAKLRYRRTGSGETTRPRRLSPINAPTHYGCQPVRHCCRGGPGFKPYRTVHDIVAIDKLLIIDIDISTTSIDSIDIDTDSLSV